MTNWLADEAKRKNFKLKEIIEIINIRNFWNSYCNNLIDIGLFPPSEFSDIKLQKLNDQDNERYIFENSLCNFHKSFGASPYIGFNNDDDDSTIFTYTPTRRYM